jgi:hypothetical protein
MQVVSCNVSLKVSSPIRILRTTSLFKLIIKISATVYYVRSCDTGPNKNNRRTCNNKLDNPEFFYRSCSMKQTYPFKSS